MATMPLNRRAGRLAEIAVAGFLRDALAQYRREVEAAALQPSTKHDYQRHPVFSCVEHPGRVSI